MADESVSPVIAKFCSTSFQGADAVNYVEPQTPHVRLTHAVQGTPLILS